MAAKHQRVEFNTIDGLTLRGWLYLAASFGPAVIITPGLPCVKEMFVLQIAEAFNEAGFTTLIYDPRHIGESDGLPRRDIDPAKQVSDYSDALSFLRTNNMVDSERIAFWGMSFSATIALCAASLDKRAKLCIAACPYLSLKPPAERITQVLAKCQADRESRLAGNPPTYLPLLTEDGRNPAGLNLHPTTEELELIRVFEQRGETTFDKRSTLETYLHFLVWNPKEIIKYLTQPVLLIVPELDTWCPSEEQFALFEALPEPKRLLTVPEKGHLTLFDGIELPNLMQTQIEFLQNGFEGNLT